MELLLFSNQKEVMEKITFTILKNSRKTDIKTLNACNTAKMAGFKSNIRNLAIVLEAKSTKSIYYTASTKKGFVKKDSLEFEKVWLEYNRSDKDYEVELVVS